MNTVDLTHDDIAELLGAYALDAVDADERDLVEAHLATCPRCAAEVAEHREVAAMLAHPGAPAPEGIWTRIQDSLEEPAPDLRMPRVEDPDVIPLTGDRRSRRDRRASSRWLPAGAAAAAAVVVIALVAGVLVSNRSDGGEQPAIAAPTLEDVVRRALNDPDSRTVELVSPSGELVATAAIEPDGDGYLVGTTLPALSAAETYQLWAINDTVVISLGTLGHSPDVVAFHVDDGVEQLAITREVAGGVPQSANAPLLIGDVS